MITRLASLAVAVFVLAFFAACSESPASNPVPTVPVARPTPTATVTPTPVPTATPVVLFEESLSNSDLARFQALPAELRTALLAESVESGNQQALGYLHDMRDHAVPVAELLTPETLAMFDSLNEAAQRQLLLEGYPNATVRYREDEWRAGDLTDLEYTYGLFELMVGEAHKILTIEGELLPPLTETLSQSSSEKFDSLNPLLQESFRLVWENTRMNSTIDPAGKLERDLLNMPLEMPGINSLGLLTANVKDVLREESSLWEFAQRIVAADLVRTQEWDSGDAVVLQQLVAAYDAPGGKAAFERGLVPGQNGHGLPLACMYYARWGVAIPDAAVPRPFRDLHPSKLVFAWPAPEDSLSDVALEKLAQLGA